MQNGDSEEIKIEFDSKDWGQDTGYLVNKHIYVIYNGGSQVIYFTGRVYSKDSISKVEFSPTRQDVGEITQGTKVAFRISVKNNNLNPVSIIKVHRSSSTLGLIWKRNL